MGGERRKVIRSKFEARREKDVAMPPPPSNSSRKERLLALAGFLFFSIGAFVLVQKEVKEPYMVRFRISALDPISFALADPRLPSPARFLLDQPG